MRLNQLFDEPKDATFIPTAYIMFKSSVSVTAVETENKKKVGGLDNNDNVMKGSVWLYAPGNE